AMGYQLIFTMDADLSHDANSLPALRDALADADVALGSRYVAGGGTQHWPWWRQMLSRGGSAYAQFILGLPIRDLTGGFKGFRRSVLETLLPDLDTIRSHGYAFQIEMSYRCARHGFHIVEVPILFTDRREGKSKMRWSIIAEALWVVCVLRLHQRQARPHGDAQSQKWIMRPGIIALIVPGVCLLLIGAIFTAPYVLSGHEKHTAHARRASLADPHPTVDPPTATPVSDASVKIQGKELTPNVPFTFAGSEFAPNEALTATIENEHGQTTARLGSFAADHTGAVNITWQAILPKLTPGSYTLIVTGERSRRTAQETFQLRWIPPNVTLSSFSVKPRQAIDFSGGGFHSGETVDVHLGKPASAPLASAPTNNGGNLTGHVTIPPLAAGSYTLYFIGRQSQTPVKVKFL
ncbi:MAG TPA: glycosyltransferase, partial [Ktedonobacterales bacterium]|nr:glycosyltransferase [Ktedonobacterales bacterium]